MHMSDALISPAVGVAMWTASAGAIAYSSKKVRDDLDDRMVPLMGVLGAFIFAAQMINFTIPGTGSSGHLGGGMLLAILLGPYASFLVISSVLVVQALFFADGGLLALGCNIFNLGFVPAFIACPLIFKKIVGDRITPVRLTVGATLGAVVSLQLGAFSVVLETLASGITELPFPTFVILMQPVHLAIGLVEGIMTAAVVSFLWKASPKVFEGHYIKTPAGGLPLRSVALLLIAVAIITGGFFSWYASENPDGLEWSIANVTGKEALGSSGPLHGLMASLQKKTAFLPDYSFGVSKGTAAEAGGQDSDVRLGTTVSGIVGGLIILACAFLLGFILKKRTSRHT